MNNDTARKWMTSKLVAVTMKTSLNQAKTKMDEYGIRHLIVEDDFGNLIGILSDRDLLRAMKPFPTSRSEFEGIVCEFDPKLQVSDFMSWPAVTVKDTTSIYSIVEQMLNGKFSAVVVERENGNHPIGILTTTDLLQLLKDLLSDEKPAMFNQKTSIQEALL